VGELEIAPGLRRVIESRYPNGLFRHQKVALEHVLAGRHTVISTATSSGKSLAFMVPALDAVLRGQQATSLFIFPQKALANDQLVALQSIAHQLQRDSGGDIRINRYDGATPSEQRAAIRERAHIVLTNPDMLHLSMLGNHDKWAAFWRRLRYVVIDEAHEYRGIFGSSVAYILRRLRMVTALYGTDPVFISASATIHNAQSHLSDLTGLSFSVIGPDLDGSIQGQRRLWLLSSDEHYWQTGRRLTQALLENGLRCLTFCGSRKSAELLFDDLPDSLRQRGDVRVYRAGLDSTQREETEAALRSGAVRGVFSTNALELGIDIGSLDAMVCVGLPGTMMSLWQRAGRVGRAGKEGAMFFIGADTPLDSYYLKHPQELFERTAEPLAVNLHNRRLLSHHLACAIEENGDEESLPAAILGPDMEHALKLRREGLLPHMDVFYSDDKHGRTPVRSSDNSMYDLVNGAESVGCIDHWHMLREAYPKAVYLHGGMRFRVTDILRSKRVIRLRPEYSRNTTQPVVRTSIRVTQVRQVAEYSDLTVTEARLEVKDLLVSISERRADGTRLGEYPGSQGLLPYLMPTEGVVIEVKGQLFAALSRGLPAQQSSATFRAVSRLIGSMLPTVLGPCDRQDYAEQCDPGSESVRVYLYDSVHDGIDLSVRAFEHFAALIDKAADRVASCDCDSTEGCFRCIKNPDVDDAVYKADCAQVLGGLRAHLASGPIRVHTFDVDLVADIAPERRVCVACGTEIGRNAKFCPECGERQMGVE
jgi:DEAD/DEAH box helicase domain-containing protein